MMPAILCLSLLMLLAEALPVPQEELFRYIDAHQDEYIQRLKEWVAIESDSSNPEKRHLVTDMMNVAKEMIKKMGGSVQMAELGDQELPNGQKLPLPPVILAEIGSDPKKPTVCFYGHLDVQPAKKEDGWATEPYKLEEKNGNLYGRGTSDDKGQVLALLHAIEAAQVNGLPVNVKLIFEGMEEVGSNGLDKLAEERKTTFLDNVDYFAVTDTAWISNTPGITYGARGNCYFFLEVQGATKDLHSGTFGGSVHEAMSDLIYLLGTLADSSGRILIPGIYDAVAPLKEEEKKLYTNLTFNLDQYKVDAGATKLLYDTKEDVLMRRWRYPSLSIHGIEGAFSGSGTKTVIPAKVIGKFSMRQVPNMEPSVVEKQVTDYLNMKFAERNSPNKVKVTMVIGAKPWLSDMNEPQYLAAQRAVTKVFQVDADMIRAGGTIPIAKSFHDLTGKSVMLLGIGGPDDASHGQNEKISRNNYLKGTKLYAVFLHELAAA
ncbi:cytosolic non-specific dipeptidase-like [Ambystoma mexicanum]|uniref:cytosolic non-specific dipeptidase-like n=1 Tax=Ambystoma mexicanum TaxID=8296 RepID=UPI0037E73C40